MDLNIKTVGLVWCYFWGGYFLREFVFPNTYLRLFVIASDIVYMGFLVWDCICSREKPGEKSD